MKKILFSILGAFMVSTMASAQTYVNVELKDGTIRSYSAESTSKVSFGEKKGTEQTPSEYYSKEEVDEKIKNLKDRIAKAERLITAIINNDSRNVGHEYVELAGYKWATENVGSVPGLESCFAPGYGYLYCQADALKAVKSWGGTWTLPTKEQWQALIDSCYMVWANDYNGQNGIIVYEAQTDDDKGKYIGNSTPSEVYTSTNVPHIFLPAAGFYNDGSHSADDMSSLGYYWSASIRYYFAFSNAIRLMDTLDLEDCMSVRPVSE